MLTEALTSGCRRTWTWCEPADLIGSGTTILRRSISGPPASRTAAAMSDGPTEPDSQLLQPGSGRLRVLERADLADRAGPLDQLDLLFRATRPRHRESARKQVVTAIAGGHVHHVTRRSEAADLLSEDQLHWRARHRSAPPCLSEQCWCRGAAPSRGRS